MKSKRLRMLHANFIQKIPLLFKKYIKTAIYYIENNSKIIFLKKGFYIMSKEEKIIQNVHLFGSFEFINDFINNNCIGG